MNKQEFYEIGGIDKFVPVELISMADTVCHIQVKTVEGFKDLVVPTFYSFEMPKQAAIPQFVADYIGYCKNEGMSLYIAMNNAQGKETDWIIDNEELFARAWLDGYEIEQEKFYTVEIPNPNWRHPKGCVTGLVNRDGVIVICQSNALSHLTESEIKQDFEWAWDAGFAKEVE